MKAYAIPLIVPGGRQYIQLLKENGDGSKGEGDGERAVGLGNGDEDEEGGGE